MEESLRVDWASFFYFKLGLFVMHAIAQHMHARPSLELKIWPRFCPVNLSLSILKLIGRICKL